ncbi:M48 family metallopeptidase [Haloglomus halophilum]|uniref:M48 family metallopeptidase n=1 Tax=Haloglomus halophilum TaxID=2962672 RepID=UPI0020C9E482|nr:M48 family metalloprotease [Haloglomus halophilum]
MRSLVTVVAGHALLAAGWAAMAYSVARRDAFAHDPLRRPAVVAVAGLTAALWAVTAGLTGALEAWLATLGLGPDWPETLATAATFVGPVAATALVTHVAGGGHPRRFALGYGALVGPALALTLLPTGWWLVAGVATLGLGMAALPPVLVPRFVPTRSLRPDECASLAPVLASDEVGSGTDPTTRDGIRVRVLALGTDGPATAVAAGVLPVPGGRVVFVTERVLSRLGPGEAAAVVAHELGHHRRRHVPLRLGAATVFLLPWLGATAAEVPGAFLTGLVLVVPAVLGLLWLVRWTEFDADRQAAAEVGAEPMARALERLGAAGALGDGGGPLSLHPAVGDRVRRLRGTPAASGARRLPDAGDD